MNDIVFGLKMELRKNLVSVPNLFIYMNLNKQKTDKENDLTFKGFRGRHTMSRNIESYWSWSLETPYTSYQERGWAERQNV